MSQATETPILPAHIEETVRAIARLHAEHYEQATPLQKIVDKLTARAGRPEFVALLTALVVGWIALKLILMATGRPPLDEPPFFWMQGAIGLAALDMTLLILATQRREDERRAIARSPRSNWASSASRRRPRSSRFWRSFGVTIQTFGTVSTGKLPPWRRRPIRRRCSKPSRDLPDRRRPGPIRLRHRSDARSALPG